MHAGVPPAGELGTCELPTAAEGAVFWKHLSLLLLFKMILLLTLSVRVRCLRTKWKRFGETVLTSLMNILPGPFCPLCFQTKSHAASDGLHWGGDLEILILLLTPTAWMMKPLQPLGHE